MPLSNQIKQSLEKLLYNPAVPTEAELQQFETMLLSFVESGGSINDAETIRYLVYEIMPDKGSTKPNATLHPKIIQLLLKYGLNPELECLELFNKKDKKFNLLSFFASLSPFYIFMGNDDIRPRIIPYIIYIIGQERQITIVTGYDSDKHNEIQLGSRLELQQAYDHPIWNKAKSSIVPTQENDETKDAIHAVFKIDGSGDIGTNVTDFGAFAFSGEYCDKYYEDYIKPFLNNYRNLIRQNELVISQIMKATLSTIYLFENNISALLEALQIHNHGRITRNKSWISFFDFYIDNDISDAENAITNILKCIKECPHLIQSDAASITLIASLHLNDIVHFTALINAGVKVVHDASMIFNVTGIQIPADARHLHPLLCVQLVKSVTPENINIVTELFIMLPSDDPLLQLTRSILCSEQSNSGKQSRLIQAIIETFSQSDLDKQSEIIKHLNEFLLYQMMLHFNREEIDKIVSTSYARKLIEQNPKLFLTAIAKHEKILASLGSIDSGYKETNDIDGMIAQFPEKSSLDNSQQLINSTMSGNLHHALIYIIKRLGYTTTSSGFCFGAVFTALQLASQGKLGQFIDLMNFLSSKILITIREFTGFELAGASYLHLEKLSIDILNIGRSIAEKKQQFKAKGIAYIPTKEEDNLLQLKVLIESIALYQDPGTSKELIDNISNQNETVLLSGILEPTDSSNHPPRTLIYSPLLLLTINESDFKSFITDIESRNEALTIFLFANGHAIGLHYDNTLKQWTIIDSNHLDLLNAPSPELDFSVIVKCLLYKNRQSANPEISMSIKFISSPDKAANFHKLLEGLAHKYNKLTAQSRLFPKISDEQSLRDNFDLIIEWLNEKDTDIVNSTILNFWSAKIKQIPFYFYLSFINPIHFKEVIENKVTLPITDKIYLGLNIVHYSCILGNVDFIDLLFEKNPDLLKQTNDYGLSPADCAFIAGSAQSLMALKKHGIEPSQEVINAFNSKTNPLTTLHGHEWIQHRRELLFAEIKTGNYLPLILTCQVSSIDMVARDNAGLSLFHYAVLFSIGNQDKYQALLSVIDDLNKFSANNQDRALLNASAITDDSGYSVYDYQQLIDSKMRLAAFKNYDEYELDRMLKLAGFISTKFPYQWDKIRQGILGDLRAALNEMQRSDTQARGSQLFVQQKRNEYRKLYQFLSSSPTLDNPPQFQSREANHYLHFLRNLPVQSSQLQHSNKP